jgi:hypothetical protein
MDEVSQLWLALSCHLKKKQPKNASLWKELPSNRKECNYCERPGGGALICCSNSSCRCRAHCDCALTHGSLTLEENGTLLFACDKHTEPIFFCSCNSPYDAAGGTMTACDVCDEWFHNSCAGLDVNEEVRTHTGIACGVVASSTRTRHTFHPSFLPSFLSFFLCAHDDANILLPPLSLYAFCSLSNPARSLLPPTTTTINTA